MAMVILVAMIAMAMKARAVLQLMQQLPELVFPDALAAFSCSILWVNACVSE